MLLITTSSFPSLNRSPAAAPRPGRTTASPVPVTAGCSSNSLSLKIAKQQRPLGEGRSPVIFVHRWIHVAV